MLSDVLRGKQLFRIEAEYFQKKYLEVEKKFSISPSINSVNSKITCGPFGSNLLDTLYENDGVLVVRPFNLKKCKVEDENLVYIKEESLKANNLKTFKEGTLLFSRVGDIKIGVLNKRKKTTISPNIIAVEFDNDVVAKFLCVFYQTKFGYGQIERQLKISAQPTISTEIIGELKFPLLSSQFQSKISFVLDKSFELDDLSNNTYSQAENLLLESLGLNEESLDCHEAKASRNDEVESLEKKLVTPSLRGAQRRVNPELQNQKSDKFSHLSINQKSFKESFLNTGRLDAEYYQPKYEEITNQIKLREYAKLSDLVLIQKSIEPGSEAYLENGLEFIRVANLNKFGISKSEIFLDEERYSGTIKPKKDTILLSKDGTVGIAYKVSEDLNCITSGAILHLTINQKNILPDYLTLVLNSKLVQIQAERDSGGSIIQHWKPSEIMEILIPIIDQPTQAKISSLIQTSFALKTKSEKLLETAKKAVEMAIEENEERALEFIAKMK